MAETGEPIPVPVAVRAGIFEVNLLGDRVQHMHRRMRFFQICSGLALVMIVAGGLLAATTAAHLVAYIRAGQGAASASAQLAEAQKGEAELNAQRQKACDALGSLGALSSIGRRRVAWAPKLAALAQALPPGGGILTVEAQSGDTFYQPAPAAAPVLDKLGKEVPRPAAKPPAPPVMKFAVLVSPSLGAGNLMSLLERLRRSGTFMERMGQVRLDAAVQDEWMGAPASVLSGSCTGAEEVKP